MSFGWNEALRLALAFGIAGAAAPSDGKDLPEHRVRVAVSVASGMEHFIVQRGLDEAARIYRRGGLIVEWLAATDPHDERTLRLIVLPRDVVRSVGSGSALGTAPREPGEAGRIAYVFFEPIETLAVKQGVHSSLLLGAAIAHELGHLLLPDREHSKEGLMRPSWGPAEAEAANHGALRFLPEDFAAMRSRLALPVVAAADARLR